MFIGHFGVGFGLKRSAPAVSLGTLFLGAQFIDLLWPSLLLLGVERAQLAPAGANPPILFTHYPISHSLALVLMWAGIFGGGYYLLRRDRVGAVVGAVAVISHWILDLVVHHPDLPLLPGVETKVGLGLWHSLPGSLAVELAIFGGGIWLYARTTAALNRRGTYGFWSLVVFLLVLHAANLFGAPPPSIAAVAAVGHAQWLLVLWAYWVDSHRRAIPAVGRPRAMQGAP